MRTSESTAAVFPAFVSAAKELQNPAKSQSVQVKTQGGGSFSYTFAPLPEILDDVRGVLGKHQLAVLQEATDGEGGVGITTRIIHESGEWVEFGPLMLPSGKDAQSAGSALTYSRRYALTAAVGIAADEDDDGSKAKAPSRQKKDTEASESEPDDGYARTGIPRPGSDGSPKKATKGQLTKLATLSNDLGWDDDERRKRAGVESFTDLSMRRATELVAEWQKLKESPAALAATESEASNGEPERRLISGNAGEVEGSVPDETAANASDAGVVPDPVKGGDAEPIGDGEATEEQWAKLIRFLDGDEAKAHKLVQERFGSQSILASQMRELIADLLREGKP